jgi:HEAT repeat protein
MLLGAGFFASLSYFRKENVVSPITQLAPVDQMLNELKQESEANQLDAIAHLGEMRDSRIVPALTSLLLHTKSEQLIEALVEALAKQQDPRAIPVLRQVDEGNYDDFLKLSIAKAELTLGDIEGFDTLINILKDNEAAFARQQAIELLEARSGRTFGYRPDLSVTENHQALLKIEEWWLQAGRHLQWDPKKKQFHS